MAFEVQVNGLRKRIADMEEMIGYRAIDMVNELSGIGEAQAKALAPVQSGELRESIHMQAAKIEGDEVVGSFGTNCDHAVFAEYGTGQRGMSGLTANGQPKDPDESVTYTETWPGMEARPYMYPASQLLAEVADDVRTKYAKKIVGGENA